MPHVTNFKLKAKPGERQAVIDLFQRWDQQNRPKAKGFIRGMLTSNLEDPEQFMAGVMFDTTENYTANSNSPETNAWFEELRSHLSADPEWFDGSLELQMNA